MTGVVDYFPDALTEVAKLPVFECENTEEEAALCAADIVDCLMGRGGKDADGERHSVLAFGAAIALLQYELTGEFLIDDHEPYSTSLAYLLRSAPEAFEAIAAVSYAGNEQHNPGEPLHWARGKSADQADTALRHLMERGTVDIDGHRHMAKCAWRCGALAQEELERDLGLPMSRGSRPAAPPPSPGTPRSEMERHDLEWSHDNYVRNDGGFLARRREVEVEVISEDQEFFCTGFAHEYADSDCAVCDRYAKELGL